MRHRPHAAAIVALLFAACHTGLAKKQPKLVASRAGQQSIGDAEICGGIRRCDLVAVRKSQVSEQRRRDLVVMTVGLALFNDVLLLLMLVPMLPALGKDAGASDMHLALLFATKDIFQVVCAPIAGMTTLRLGARVSFAASLLGLALSTVAFAEARGFRALLLARALQGATSAALMTGGLSLITQTHDPSSRASAIAKAHSGLGLGAALGPVLGGLAYDTLGRRGTFYAAAALVLLTFAAQVVLSVAAPAPLMARQPDSAEEKTPALRQLTSLLANRDMRLAACGIFAAYACGGLYDAMYGVHVSDAFGYGPSQASLLFSIEPSCYLLLLLLLAPLADGAASQSKTTAATAATTPSSSAHAGRWRSKPGLTALGLALTGLSLPLLPLGAGLRRGSHVSLVASLLVHGAGYAVRDLVGHGLLADLVDRHRVGSYAMAFALADCADSLGYIAGPLVGFALARLLRSRLAGLLLVGIACASLAPPIAGMAARSL
jgi:MFS family permease